MSVIASDQLFLLLILLLTERIHCFAEENSRVEIFHRPEHADVRFVCDLMDVAWWKRPDLLATRSETLLARFRSKMLLERLENKAESHVLHVHHLKSNDSGVYECETLGGIRLFNLTVTVRLTTVELGAQFLSSDESIIDPLSPPPSSSNQTKKQAFHQSSSSNNGYVHLREHQLLRLTCVVARARPAASLHFPFDIDYRLERNSTTENNDQTFRTILVLTIPVDRRHHQRLFFCQAIQRDSPLHEDQHVRSNTLLMDVAYSPRCSSRSPFLPDILTALGRPINLTCHMNNGNPSKINFTWHLPNGHIRLGHHLNATSSYITVVPKEIDEFGPTICRAQNDLGLFGQCHLKMILGAVPDPINSCRYTYVNTTLTVNCMAGFHQGDEDFFCYMYKRQENGSYSEHARLRGNCAFILPDLKPENHHDFRVFTKNKYGDNFDRSYSIKVGRPRESLVEKTRIYWPYMALFVVGACLASIALVCFSCRQVRKTMSKKRKTTANPEDLTYQNHNSHPSSVRQANSKVSSVYAKQNGNGSTYPVRPYRSKDQLIASEPSTLHRHHPPSFKSLYSTDPEGSSAKRNTLKETDLDHLIASSKKPGANGPVDTAKTLPLNRDRTLFRSINPNPLTMQRRSSFQTATKLNSLDFYSSKEPVFFFDKPSLHPTQRNHYSPERDLRERDFYREKRRTYSPLAPTYPNRQSSLVMENHFSTNNSYLGSKNTNTNPHEPSWRDNSDYSRDQTKDNQQLIFRAADRDDGIFV